jgi:hypothetical protein
VARPSGGGSGELGVGGGESMGITDSRRRWGTDGGSVRGERGEVRWRGKGTGGGDGPATCGGVAR